MEEKKQIEDIVLRTDNLKRGYPLPGGGMLWALGGVSLEIPRGKLTILKGKSGSGKTTLMNLLGALDAPTEGSISMFSEDGRELRLDSSTETERTALRRKTLGFVFQSVALIPMMSARENVDFALRLGGYTGNREERVRECLDLVGLGARADHMPSQLSGGEQQRVAIARAIAHRPGIVFADEPTGELDTQTAISVVRLFRQLNETQKITIVMSTHDKGFMEIGDRVYELEGGLIVHGSADTDD